MISLLGTHDSIVHTLSPNTIRLIWHLSFRELPLGRHIEPRPCHAPSNGVRQRLQPRHDVAGGGAAGPGGGTSSVALSTADAILAAMVCGGRANAASCASFWSR